MRLIPFLALISLLFISLSAKTAYADHRVRTMAEHRFLHDYHRYLHRDNRISTYGWGYGFGATRYREIIRYPYPDNNNVNIVYINNQYSPPPVLYAPPVLLDKISYDQAGRYCREYQSMAKIGGMLQNVYGTACRQQDGSWEIVN